MRKVCSVSILSLLYFVASGQNVASVNGKPISSKEFMWVYKKNHSGVTNASLKDLSEYLDLYINLKLKVIDAKGLGLDVDTAYKAEINGYENALKSQKKAFSKNKEYDYIMNEYREGVLMFNVSEIKVWSKVQYNEHELKDFYTKNMAKYDQPFDESKGQIITDYQQQLEKEWIKSLKSKYIVKINDEELKKLAKP